jgi:hypothetical protein
MDGKTHLLPSDGDTHHRQGADLDAFGKGMERIYGKFKPTGRHDKIKPKDLRVDVTTTTSANLGSFTDRFRDNYQNIDFSKND